MATTAATSVGAAVAAAAAATTGTTSSSATSSNSATNRNSNQMNDDNSTLVYCQLQIEHRNRDVFSVNVESKSSIHQIKEAIVAIIKSPYFVVNVETMKLYGDIENELANNTMWASLVNCGTEAKPLIVKIEESSTNNEDEDENAVAVDEFEFTDADESVASLSLYVDKVNTKVYYEHREGDLQVKTPIPVHLTDRHLEREYRNCLYKAAADLMKSDVDESTTTSTTCGIVEEKLLALVESTYSLNKYFRPPVQHATRAANSANEVPPDISGYYNSGEMHLQQVVYNPIAEMFCAFSNNYCANIKVSCANSVTSMDDTGTQIVNCTASCNPDATLRLTRDFYLIAMMELKVEACDPLNEKDFFRCVLMTTMSVMAICNYMPQGYKEDISIPFIQGNSGSVKLYVTTMKKDDNYPKIHFVAEAYFTSESVVTSEDNNKKIDFLAKLAVLLSWIVKLANEHKTKMMVHFNNVHNNVEADAKKQNLLSDAPNPSQTKRGNANASSSNQKKQNTNEGKGANANETAAKLATSQRGLVKGLVHPFPRIGSLNLDLLDDKNAMYEEDLKYFQQESPFFFKGVAEQDGDVFCKVWREGDRHTSRKDVEEEIQLYKRANAEGIPSPKVVDRLTVLDMECMTTLDLKDFKPSTYHVLVTQYHRNDKVAECDIGVFAFSLVNAVQKLHSIGILHCDIKPNNILWDATQKKLLLIDFGHAQEELNARWYTSTRMFEAPEISQKEPHSTKSDAFSVGKTLEYVIAKFSNKVDPGIAGVVQSLINESESKRLLLADAETQLKQYNNVNTDPKTTTATTTNGSSNCFLATKKRSIGDVNIT